MTEYSYFHNGTALGDADQAPYTSELYCSLRNLLWSSEKAFVHAPDAYATSTNPFGVTPSAGMVVAIAQGNALIGGHRISLGGLGTTRTIPNNISGMPRIDRVVVRVVWRDSLNYLTSGTLYIKQGTPSTTPSPPPLIQVYGDTYEMSLARIYVPNGLAAVTADYIIDEREFFERAESYYANENLMPNSEFMAGANTSATLYTAGNGSAPAHWIKQSTGTICEIDDKFSSMSRGSTVKVTCPALNDGLSTTIYRLANASNLPVTIRLLIEVIQGEVWIDTAGGGANGVRVPAGSGMEEVILRRTATAADRDIELWIYNILSTQTVFKLGQVTVAHGLVGAPYLPKKELIFLSRAITQTGYTTSDAQITGVAEIEPESNFAPGISSLLMRLQVNDSGSAGNDTINAAVQNIDNNTNQLRCEIGRLTNSSYACNQGFVGVPYDEATKTQKIQVATTASGAFAMIVELASIGCMT